MWFPLSLFMVQAEPERQWVTPAIQAPGVKQVIFESKAAKSKVSFHIYLPSAYEKAKDRRFPVLYWLHGSGGGLPGIRPVSGFFASAMDSGKIPPTIVVFPNSFANGMWCDSADGKTPIETILIEELIPYVDATYRTKPAKEGRILEGFSMGGYGAGRLGFKYPNKFSGVSILAGGPLDLEFQGPRAAANARLKDQILKTVYGGDMAVYRAQSPWVLAEQHAKSLKVGPPLRICVGEDDFTLEANKALADHLSKLGIKHTFLSRAKIGHDTLGLLNALGDENWTFYREAIPEN